MTAQFADLSQLEEVMRERGVDGEIQIDTTITHNGTDFISPIVYAPDVPDIIQNNHNDLQGLQGQVGTERVYQTDPAAGWAGTAGWSGTTRWNGWAPAIATTATDTQCNVIGDPTWGTYTVIHSSLDSYKENIMELMKLILKCIEKGMSPQILVDVSEQLKKDSNCLVIIAQLTEYLKEKEDSIDDFVDDFIKDIEKINVQKPKLNLGTNDFTLNLHTNHNVVS